MKRMSVIGLMVILALSAFSGCGGDSDGGPPAQPVRAHVFIAFNQEVTNLAGLDFVLNSAPGATFDNTAQQIAPLNAAEGSMTAAASFDAATNTNRIGLATGNPAGINTGTSPIIRITYEVAAGSGVPTFGIATQAPFSAVADDNLTPTTPPVTAEHLVVTVTYE